MTEGTLKAGLDEGPSATEAIEAIARGEITVEETVRRCLARIEALEPEVRAFVDIGAEKALAAARAADATPPERRGALHGLPVAVKEIFDVAGLRCCWGTPIHESRIPRQDAEIVRRLKAAGAIVVGTTVSTEYAIGAAGPTLNPCARERSPGGSSSGSAAAVASGMVAVALASQTVGSVVRPATYCGVFGLKPTRGAIPLRGTMALSPRLDHPGLMARAPGDLAPLCRALFGPDPADPQAVDIAPPGELPRLEQVQVLVAREAPPGPIAAPSREAVERAARRLGECGAQIARYAFPDDYDTVVEVIYAIVMRDMAVAHGGDRDRAGARMSPLMRDLIDRGRNVDDADYARAHATADCWRRELDQRLGRNAVILSAATEGIAPPRAEGTGSNRLQALWSLVGLPVVAIPCGLHDGLPVGVQVGAGAEGEACLLAVAGAFAAAP